MAIGVDCVRRYIQRMKSTSASMSHSLLEVAMVFFRLGLTSFGGPVAHMGYFHREFVQRRSWLTERDFADWMAMCQFLPGPASSQLGMVVGRLRAGLPGALVAWLAFTLPSALLLMALAAWHASSASFMPQGLVQGLKWVAVAVVAQALWSMGRTSFHRPLHMALAAIVALIGAVSGAVWVQLACVLLAGLVASRFGADTQRVSGSQQTVTYAGWKTAAFMLGAALLALPIVAWVWPSSLWPLVDSFFRAGAWVMGGGHVVLPLLEAEVVQPGWVSADQFLTGYGLAQAVPGPLFTLSAYLGALSPWGWWAGWVALVAIFAPSILWVWLAMPHWQRWRHLPSMQAAMGGVHAAVWGLLLSAWLHPVLSSAVYHVSHAIIAAALLWLLIRFKGSVGWVVLLGAASGVLQHAIWGL